MNKITIEVEVLKNIDEVWTKWTDPSCVVVWNHASDDWCCPKAENDLREGGSFSYTMAATDGSASFNFYGIYNKVDKNSLIEYTLGDGRKVVVNFESIDNQKTKVIETFDAEEINSIERQKSGWQAILLNFKEFCEK